VISAGKATYYELDTFLSLEDLYDILEVLSVDTYNRILLNKREEKKWAKK